MYKLFRRNGDFNSFLHDIRIHLKETYPNIKFELNNIIKKTENEKDSKRRQILIIEDLVSQFIDYEYELQTQDCIDKDLLWSNYEAGSKPINNRRPNDWIKRKDFTYRRDNCKCKRCGLKISSSDAYVSFVKPLSKGGGYNFENLITLCSDCNKILSSESQENRLRNSLIEEDLLKKVI
ncbi:HNH endonuclease [Malaciobacter molluscorum]|uniref:HNH endonuclease n=1 Tax=Malaciobacter molluscorum TaxID=1032072 RepID=UPI0013E98DE1|nr:HNH endonuclease signature motif containing protein [Malaciobacter molluscorum]